VLLEANYKPTTKLSNTWRRKIHIPASHHVIAITLLIIGIIATSIFAFTLVLKQSRTAIAQQQPTGMTILNY
jgi:hypothetical protein